MAYSRGLITKTERERIAGKEDVSSQRRSEAVSRVRRRINEELSQDVELLAEHRPDLLAELRTVVCDETD